MYEIGWGGFKKGRFEGFLFPVFTIGFPIGSQKEKCFRKFVKIDKISVWHIYYLKALFVGFSMIYSVSRSKLWFTRY